MAKPSNTPALQLLVALLCGGVFGAAVHMSGVYDPLLIRAQMRFEDFTMVLVFLTAVGTSLLAQILLGRIAPFDREATRQLCLNRPVGLPAVIVGTMALGAGMSLGGSCPGTTMVGLGTFQWPTPYALLGGLVGAYAYAAMESSLSSFRSSGISQLKSLHSVMGMSQDNASLVMAGMMYGCVYLCLQIAPWKPHNHGWHPVLSGLLIGALQIPLTIVLHKNTGSASTYTTIVANLLPSSRLPQLVAARSGMTNTWQVTYLAGAVAASYLLCHPSNFGITVSHVTALEAFAGGFLIIWGSRLAGGCTSGVGIAGTSQLHFASWVGVCAMFAGGIPMALYLQ